MELNDWILALHLLSAFALVGAMTIFSIALAALRGADRPARVVALKPTLLVGNVAVMVGVLGTVVFGVWLAFSKERYSIWDLWIILAIVGWAVATEIGRRTGGAIGPAFTRAEQLLQDGKDAADPDLAVLARSQQAHMYHWVSVVITVLVVIDMIWKPGA